MNKLLLTICILCVSVFTHASNIDIKSDNRITSQHSIKIKGEKVNYQATVGTQPVWDTDGKEIANVFYTYYERTDVKNTKHRPLLISFNGGPGAASVWMHIGYTGPKVLKVDDEGYPQLPYGVKDNPDSVLDVADILFVDPVNTGFSRVTKLEDGSFPSKAEQKKQFFGVNADIAYLARWVQHFVSREDRWLSPKFLIGESYGTARVSGLAQELQSAQSMYLNGVVLVSPTDLGIKRDGPVDAANRLPYFAATAWYHKQLEANLQGLSLEELLAKVERYTLDTYLPALARGASVDPITKQQVAEQVAAYSGLTVQGVLANNLDVPNSYFWKKLLADEGQTVGRLDSRYIGIDKRDAGVRPDYNAELVSWVHSFTPAINDYLRGELGYKTDLDYRVLSRFVHPWDRTGNYTGAQLRSAMAANPWINVLIQSGYFDGATNYFDAKYTMWQLDPSGKMHDRIAFKGYQSGHMMYLRKPDLTSSNNDLREFMKKAIVTAQKPARYQLGK